jgi:anti-sigma B factor antagonist
MSRDPFSPAPPPLDLEVLSENERTVVRASGELDIATADKLRACLDRVKREAQPVTLDMTGIEFMDSSGLHVLIEADRAFAASGTGFSIVPSEQVLKIITIVDLVDHLPIADGGK